MKQSRKTSISLSDDELAIVDSTCGRLDMSRSEFFRHLLLYHGLCGGDFPLTTKILRLPEKDRSRVIEEIRKRSESHDPAKPQSFKQWVKETLGNDATTTVDKSADVLLKNLLGN